MVNILMQSVSFSALAGLPLGFDVVNYIGTYDIFRPILELIQNEWISGMNVIALGLKPCRGSISQNPFIVTAAWIWPCPGQTSAVHLSLPLTFNQ
jgi:hypothetical protein